MKNLVTILKQEIDALETNAEGNDGSSMVTEDIDGQPLTPPTLDGVEQHTDEEWEEVTDDEATTDPSPEKPKGLLLLVVKKHFNSLRVTKTQ